MVTASHNPKQDNGLKVFWGDGCQIVAPQDEEIAAAVAANAFPWPRPAAPRPLASDPTPAVAASYYAILADLRFRPPPANARAAPIVYTPLHGVGGPWVTRAFALFGLPTPIPVPSQAEPDPDFPTVAFPNPEEGAGVWDAAFQAAAACGATVCLANDPDADRLAVAERGLGGWRAFTGNEIAILLADWLWRHRRAWQSPGATPVALASAVSSKQLASMARIEGFEFEETLTGFKWLGSRARARAAAGDDPFFAYEEAIGFAVRPGILHDKDGVAAAAVFAEMTAEVYDAGGTLSARLTELDAKYGPLSYRACYYAGDPADTTAVMERLRASPPAAIGGATVVRRRDLGAGLDTGTASRSPALPWRPSDLMLTYWLDGIDGGPTAVLTLRASGTEPKLKVYLEADGSGADAAADALLAAAEAELVRPGEHGLRRGGGGSAWRGLMQGE